jgi:hypothetical protein
MRAGAALVLATLVATAVRAEPVPAPLPDEARLRELSVLLDQQASAVRTWRYSWLGIHGAFTAGQLVLSGFVDETERIGMYLGAGSSVVGALTVALTPAVPDGSGPASELEMRLRSGALAERVGTAWWAHVANAAFNVARGAILGLVFGQWTSGLVTAIGGTAIGELMILTQPTALIPVDAAWPREAAAR